MLLLIIMIGIAVSDPSNSNILNLSKINDKLKKPLYSSDNFNLLAFDINFDIIYIFEQTCDYDTTCPNLLCATLSNKTLSSIGLAFLMLFPNGKVSCNKVINISNTTMITFILNKKGKLVTPISCNTVGECFSETCILFNENKNSGAIGFMGQCKLY